MFLLGSALEQELAVEPFPLAFGTRRPVEDHPCKALLSSERAS
jgi:hypothetical protein